MRTGRGIDHIGIAARNLDTLAATYQDLGFTLTPRAWHPDHMGTSNRLVQFAGRNFIELIEVDRPGSVAPHEDDHCSFGAFIAEVLERREGLTLIVLRTGDTPADIDAWRRKGLDTYRQFDFERIATLPDGTKAEVRFSLGFVTHPHFPDALFYVCHNRAEAHFWKPEFQAHANAAEEITSIIFVAQDPAAHGNFLSDLFDGAVTEIPAGISVEFGPHSIEVRRPDAAGTPGWQQAPGDDAIAAGFAVRSPARAGTVTPPADAGGAFIEWVN